MTPTTRRGRIPFDLADAWNLLRAEARLPPAPPETRLCAVVDAYLEALPHGTADVERLAEEVHAELGPHAVAAFETVLVAEAADVSHLQGWSLPHWEACGLAASPRGDGMRYVAVVYARRDAWPGTREARARLRDGIGAFQDVFRDRYGRDPAWTRRWSAGDREAFAPLVAAAAARSGFSVEDFHRAVGADPLLEWHLRRSIVERKIDADLAHAPPGGPPGGASPKLPRDL